ncbi:MAG: NUDIX hydrolase [Deltaproteobacteria bacterium]|nr:NUDIX hydrolase [Deltaproteobacteria bacterium]
MQVNSFKPSDLVEKKISNISKTKGHWIEIHTDKIKLSNKKESIREYIRHPGAALIIPELSNGKLLFIKQFRYALGKIFIEFPAGKRDAKETTLQTAKRELREEVGYTAKKIKFLTRIHPVIGYADEVIDIYLATGLTFTGAHPDEEEFLIPLELTPKEALNLIWKQKLTDVKTQVALFWYINHQKL